MEQVQQGFITKQKRQSSYPRSVSLRSRSEWNPTLVLLIMALLTLLAIFAARELVTGAPGF